MFAVITVALISGAIADRARFGTWLVFSAIWVTIVYLPVARAVFYFGDAEASGGGFIATKIKALDFAGGTAVHINAGAVITKTSAELTKTQAVSPALISGINKVHIL